MNEETLFELIVSASESERNALLEKHCVGNPQLRSRVENLLRAHRAGPSAGIAATELHDVLAADSQLDLKESTDHDVGEILGNKYTLRERIGEGGMGAVWLATQSTPVKRKVAVKLIKAGMDSRQVVARFEAERQALAMMDHPNIAKVFDGGMTERGRPYFVMEYVKGIPLTDYCDQARLSVKQRLKLFMPICKAIQHAHQKGIVHRDLKPSNILVCLYDGEPVCKVIDFGLAKAMHQPLTEHSVYTSHGMMVGTPLYMSPEQAEYNNLDVDTRTDIYSLGVVLYELLTGTTPLEREQLRAAAYDEVLRLIKEVEPPRPSMRLSQSDSLPSIAAQRSIEPRHLGRSLSGDLDWIVMKSLEKERSRRYETVAGLERDVERYLNEDAIEARPPSSTYRIGKYLKKHKLQAFTIAAVFFATLFGATVATWGWHKANKATIVARRSLDAKNAALAREAEQREMAELALIRGILRPIGFGGTAEDLALTEWSNLPTDRLKLRVLEVGFADADTVSRFAVNSNSLATACVGLSLKRRKQAIEFLLNVQSSQEVDLPAVLAANELLLVLGETSRETLATSRSLLITKDTATTHTLRLANRMIGLKGKFPEAERIEICEVCLTGLNSIDDPSKAIVFARLLGSLTKDSDPRAQELRYACLKWFSRVRSDWHEQLRVGWPKLDVPSLMQIGRPLKQLNPREVDDRWRILLSFANNHVEAGESTESFQQHLIAMVPFLDRPQRLELWNLVLKEMELVPVAWNPTNLETIVSKLEPTEVAKLWRVLTQSIPKYAKAEDEWSDYHSPINAPHFRLLRKYINQDQRDAFLEEALSIPLPSEPANRNVVLKFNLYVALFEHADSLTQNKMYREVIPMITATENREEFLLTWSTFIAKFAQGQDANQLLAAWKAVDDPRVLGEIFWNTNCVEIGVTLSGLTQHMSVVQRDVEFKRLVETVQAGNLNFQEATWATIAICALTPHLSQQQVLELWNETSDALIEKYDEDLLDADCLVFLLKRLPPAICDDAETQMIIDALAKPDYRDRDLVSILGALTDDGWFEERITKISDEHIEQTKSAVVDVWNSSWWDFRTFNTLTRRLSDRDSSKLARQIAENWATLTYASSVPGYEVFESNPDLLSSPLRCIEDAEFLANSLMNASFPIQTTDARLRRFEELVLHQGRNVLVEPDRMSAGQSPKRAFWSPYDAAEWIATNWPDFDLDRQSVPIDLGR